MIRHIYIYVCIIHQGQQNPLCVGRNLKLRHSKAPSLLDGGSKTSTGMSDLTLVAYTYVCAYVHVLCE